LELIKKYQEFKDSLRYEGEVVKKNIGILEMNEFQIFFLGYHHSIYEIIEKIVLQPKKMA
jgi:hypothetical protein